MRIYIGTFDESEMESILQELRKAGIRSEIKPSIDVAVHVRYLIKGKLSEIKNKYKDTEMADLVEKWEKYIEVAREILKNNRKEGDFEKELLKKLIPEGDEMVVVLFEAMKDGGDEEIKKLEKIMEGKEEEEVENFFSRFREAIKIVDALHKILLANGIKYEGGEIHGNLSDDPIMIIHIEGIDGERAEKLNLDFAFDTYVDKKVDIYGNLMDIIYEREKLKKMAVKNPRYVEILILSDAIAMMLDKLEGKMELEEFFDRVIKIQEEDNRIFFTPSAIEEILETLEKMEIIKMKKGKIWLSKK